VHDLAQVGREPGRWCTVDDVVIDGDGQVQQVVRLDASVD